MKLYLAGKVTARERLCVTRAHLLALGHQVNSTWLDVAIDYPEAFNQIMEPKRDLIEIAQCSMLLLDTIDVSETGGREFEAGFAHALGKALWRVGPKRHIFHSLASREFNDWDAALTALINV